MTSKDDTLYLLDMLGRPVKALHQDYDTQVETEKDSFSTLSTTVQYDSVIKTDMQIIYRNERYVISDIADSRDRDYLTTDIQADSAYMQLSEVFTEIEVDDGTIDIITHQLLSGTKWSVGSIPRGVGGRHSLVLVKRDSSVLSTLRLLERLSDGALKLQFDTINYQVSFVRPVEYDAGFLFQYGVNVEGITRDIIAPKATVLIPTGNDDMGITTVTESNVNFVENYGYYLDQGYSLEEARANFEKIGEFKDDRFLIPGNLMREAERRLEVLAYPQIAYSTTIAYLDTPVSVGMFGYVLDNDLGIKVKSEIVRVIEEKEYNRSQVELNYLIPGIGDLQDFVSDSSPGIKIAYTQIDSQFTSLTDRYDALFQLSITNLAASNMSVGFWFQTETSKPGTLLDGYFDLDGTRTGHIVRQTLNGSDSHGYPFVATAIPEGSHILRFMVKSEGGTFTVLNEQGSMFVESESLAGGATTRAPMINYTDYVELPKDMFVEDSFKIELTPSGIEPEPEKPPTKINIEAVGTNGIPNLIDIGDLALDKNEIRFKIPGDSGTDRSFDWSVNNNDVATVTPVKANGDYVLDVDAQDIGAITITGVDAANNEYVEIKTEVVNVGITRIWPDKGTMIDLDRNKSYNLEYMVDVTTHDGRFVDAEMLYESDNPDLTIERDGRISFTGDTAVINVSVMIEDVKYTFEKLHVTGYGEVVLPDGQLKAVMSENRKIISNPEFEHNNIIEFTIEGEALANREFDWAMGGGDLYATNVVTDDEYSYAIRVDVAELGPGTLIGTDMATDETVEINTEIIDVFVNFDKDMTEMSGY